MSAEEPLDSPARDLDRARARDKVALVRSIASEYAADPGDTDRTISTIGDLFDASTGLPQ